MHPREDLPGGRGVPADDREDRDGRPDGEAGRRGWDGEGREAGAGNLQQKHGVKCDFGL